MSDQLKELTDANLVTVLDMLRIIQGVAEDKSLPRDGREMAQNALDGGLLDVLWEVEDEASRRANCIE